MGSLENRCFLELVFRKGLRIIWFPDSFNSQPKAIMKSSIWALFQMADFLSEGLLAWGRKSRAETPPFSRGWGLIANWELEWGIYISRKYQGFVISVKINLWPPSPSGRGHSQSVGRDVFLHAFQLLFWEVAAGRGFKLNRGVFRLPYHVLYFRHWTQGFGDARHVFYHWTIVEAPGLIYS